MGTSNNWLKKRKKRQLLIARIQNIAIGSLIAAFIIGPLIYFGAVAVPVEVREARSPAIFSQAATPEVATIEDIAATPELFVSDTPIQFPIKKEEPEKIKDPKVELGLEDLPTVKQQLEDVSEGTSEFVEGKFVDATSTLIKKYFPNLDKKTEAFLTSYLVKKMTLQ